MWKDDKLKKVNDKCKVVHAFKKPKILLSYCWANWKFEGLSKSMVYDRNDSSCNLCASHVKWCANLDRQWRKPKEIFKRAQWFSSQY